MSLITRHGWIDSSIQKKDKPKLVISDLLMKQIQDMCLKTPFRKEWSGPLFYKEMEGSMSDPANFVISGEFLYPMDIGSGVYTEYELLPRPGVNKSSFVKWAMQHVIGKGLQLGHVHSHHEMATFFSGTDMDELEEGSGKHNYYLSLIVNNRNELIAKIGVLLETEVEQELSFSKRITKAFTMSYNSEQKFKKTITQLVQYDLEIEMPETIVFPEWYHDAFKEMVEKNKPVPNLGIIKHPFVWSEFNEEKNKVSDVSDLLVIILSFNEEADNVEEALSNLSKSISTDVRNGMLLEDSYAEHEFYIKSNFEDSWKTIYDNSPVDITELSYLKEYVDDLKATKTNLFLSQVIEKMINEYTSQ